jgi:hypothetical protein
MRPKNHPVAWGDEDEEGARDVGQVARRGLETIRSIPWNASARSYRGAATWWRCGLRRERGAEVAFAGVSAPAAPRETRHARSLRKNITSRDGYFELFYSGRRATTQGDC